MKNQFRGKASIIEKHKISKTLKCFQNWAEVFHANGVVDYQLIVINISLETTTDSSQQKPFAERMTLFLINYTYDTWEIRPRR